MIAAKLRTNWYWILSKVKVTHLGGQGLEDVGALAGRIDARRGQVQGWSFGDGSPVPSQGRKATVQDDAVTHSRNSFSWIAVPIKKKNFVKF